MRSCSRLTYVLGDVLSEVYGLRLAKRVILTGFVLQVVASLSLWAVQARSGGGGLGLPGGVRVRARASCPRIVLASMAGYLAGQLLNAWVLVRMKQRTQGRYLWSRLIGSTIVGEFADTLVFCLVARWGDLDVPGMVNYVLVGIAWKIGVEIVMLPVTYQVIAFVRRREGLTG